MIKDWISWLLAYAEWGLSWVISHLMTIEGIIALLFGLFLVGLISRLRS